MGSYTRSKQATKIWSMKALASVRFAGVSRGVIISAMIIGILATYALAAGFYTQSGTSTSSSVTHSGPPGFEVDVTVQDLKGNPIQGALVNLQTLTQATDKNGMARFSNIPPGPYNVIVVAKGFVSATKPIDSTGGTNVTFQLSPLS